MYLYENQPAELLFLDYQNNMAEHLPRLILFGEQDADTLSYIKGVIQQSRNLPYASRFLRDCADEVQALLSGFDAEERRRYSRFEDILELAVIHAELSEESLSSETITTVLFFISQFGDLIVYVSTKLLEIFIDVVLLIHGIGGLNKIHRYFQRAIHLPYTSLDYLTASFLPLQQLRLEMLGSF